MKILKKRVLSVLFVYSIAVLLLALYVLRKSKPVDISTETDSVSYANIIRENVGMKRVYTCPETLTFRTMRDIYVCGDLEPGASFDLVLFTTIYYSESHILFFTNTMNVLASLQNDHHTKGIVFIEHLRDFKNNNASHILATTCEKGLLVLLVPQCNQHGFPVFKSMFNVTMATWDARWYGYMNGDMLFDETLLSTIRFVESHEDTVSVPIIAGRRYNIRVSFSLTSLMLKRL